MDIASLRWGKTNEEDAHHAYIAHMALQGQAVAVQDCGLVIQEENPCLACSPDGRVTSDHDRGLLEIKCPYTAAKEGLTPLQAAKYIKRFCCKQSTINQGTIELKCSHDYYYQVTCVSRVWLSRLRNRKNCNSTDTYIVSLPYLTVLFPPSFSYVLLIVNR